MQTPQNTQSDKNDSVAAIRKLVGCRTPISRRKGVLTVLAAICLVAVIAFVALAIDTGLIVLARSEMQKATDLAAVGSLATLYESENWPDVSAAESSAVQLVALNTANTIAPVELLPSDVVIGIYDEVSKSVIADVVEPDAIEVWSHRKQERGTGLEMKFAQVVGIQHADVSTSAVAYMSAASDTGVLPIALRTPTFGPVDPEIAEVNPGKDGPSYPLNGDSFEVGEQVTVFIYGKGKKSPVHLTLNIDSPGPGAPEADVKKVLRGEEDPPPVSLGDEYYVFNEGTGSGGFGSALDDRIETPPDDPMRDVVIPIVDIIPGESRVYKNNGLEWELEGKVRVVDFVSVHLDDAIEVSVPDPEKPGDTIDIRILVGTVTKRMVSDGGGGEAPSGTGGGTVMGYPKLVR